MSLSLFQNFVLLYLIKTGEGGIGDKESERGLEAG